VTEIFSSGKAWGPLCKAHLEGRVRFKLETESKPKYAAEVGLEQEKCGLQNKFFSSGQGQVLVY